MTTYMMNRRQSLACSARSFSDIMIIIIVNLY